LAREGALGGDEGFRPPAGATPRRQPAGDQVASPRARAAARARRPQLASALRNSLGDGEVNRLASLYDWGGMGKRQAQAVLDRSSA
jgi:hypothetical protein